MKLITSYLNDQLACPSGIAGQLLVKKMEKDPATTARSEWAVDLLDLSDEDQVLEVGFGNGIALELIARQIPLGSLVGIDHSSLMVKRASERLNQYKEELPLALITAAIEDAPKLEQKFSRVLTINSMMYWPEKEKCLQKIKNMMLPDSKILLVYQPTEANSTEEATRRTGRGISKLLELTGFQEVRTEINLDIMPVPAIAVSGYS